MKTFFLNSKKCCNPKSVSWAVALAALCCSPAFAAKPPHAKASVDPIERVIKKQLTHRKSLSFDNLLTDWQEQFGTQAVPALMHIASDKQAKDADRYIALMGTSKLGGSEMNPVVARFMKDPSWMMRTASIHILTTVNPEKIKPEQRAAIYKLLKDPALVVRTEAITAIERLKDAKAETELFSVLEDESNYHQGIPQWVPQQALLTLIRIPAESKIARAKRLREFVKNAGWITDAQFKRSVNQAVAVLEK